MDITRAVGAGGAQYKDPKTQYINAVRTIENFTADFINKDITPKSTLQAFDAYFVAKRGVEKGIIPKDVFDAEDLKVNRVALDTVFKEVAKKELPAYERMERLLHRAQVDGVNPQKARELEALLHPTIDHLRNFKTIDVLDKPGYEKTRHELRDTLVD